MSDLHLVEIDQQTGRRVKQLYVAQELGLVKRRNLFHRLGLHQHAALDQLKPLPELRGGVVERSVDRE